jgi:hypothetical protein
LTLSIRLARSTALEDRTSLKIGILVSIEFKKLNKDKKKLLIFDKVSKAELAM